MGSRSKGKKKFPKIRWSKPGLETLESRISPASLTYVAPTGQPFTATLRSNGTDLQLLDASSNVLADQPLSGLSSVSITGANQASALTIDMSNHVFALPITFDKGPQTNPGADVLNLVSGLNGASSATYTPGLTAGDSSTVLFGGSTISFSAFMPVSVGSVASFTFLSPGSAADLTLTSPASGETAIGGTSGGAAFGTATFTNVPSVVVDTASHSGNDQITLGASGLTAAGLTSFTVHDGTVAQGNILDLVDPTFAPGGSSASVTAGTATLWNELPVSIASLTITDDGFSIANTTATPSTLSLGTAIAFTGPTITFTGFSYSSTSGYSGSLTLSAQTAELFPGQAYSATLTSPDGVQPGVSGAFNITSQVFQLTTGNFDLLIGNALEVTGAGFTLNYNPSNPAVQTLLVTSSATVGSPEFGGISAPLSTFTLTTAGFSLGSGAISTAGTANLDTATTGATNPILAFSGVTVTFTAVSVTYGAGFTIGGSIQVSSSSATLFPDGATNLNSGDTAYTATGTNITGSFSFYSAVEANLLSVAPGTSDLELTAGSFSLNIGQQLSLTTTNFQLSPDQSVIAAPANALGASLNYLSLTVSLTGLEIANTGAITVGNDGSAGVTLTGYANNLGGNNSIYVDSSGNPRYKIRIGGILPENVTGIAINWLQAPPSGSSTASSPYDLTDFDLNVTGYVDDSVFKKFPLGTPIIQIGTRMLDGSTVIYTTECAVENGQLTPVTLGPINIGFSGYKEGPTTLGGTIILGGYKNGALVPTIGGSITATGNDASGDLTLTGTYSDGTLTIAGTGAISFNMEDGKIEVQNAELSFGLVASYSASGGFSVSPIPAGQSLPEGGTADGYYIQSPVTAGLIQIQVGTLMQFDASNVSLDFTATGSEPLITFSGADSSAGALTSEGTLPPNAKFSTNTFAPGTLSVTFLKSAGPLAGWGGGVGDFAIGADGSLQILPNFNIQLEIGSNMSIGLPSWLPFTLTHVGLQFDNSAISNGVIVNPDQFTVYVSGMVKPTDDLPLTGGFTNLGIDVGQLITDLETGGNPFNAITNLNGFSIGVKNLMIGGASVSGNLTLGKLMINGQTAIYMEVMGKILIEGNEIGIDVALSNYGPLIATLSGGCDLPFGFTLDFNDVGLVFGGPNFPEITNPQDIFSNPNLQNPTTISVATITQTLTNALNNHQYTWDAGVTLVGSCTISNLAVQGMITGTVTIGANIALQGQHRPEDPRRGLHQPVRLPHGQGGPLL